MRHGDAEPVSPEFAMPFLDASALENDPDGMRLLAAVLGGARSDQPKADDAAAHLGRAGPGDGQAAPVLDTPAREADKAAAKSIIRRGRAALVSAGEKTG
jgi:hypothetical protein